MSATANPRGFLPVQKHGSRPNNGGLRLMKIASGYSTAIYYGDLVKLVVGGTIEKEAGTTTAKPVGVFLGVQWTDPTYGPTFRQYYPGSVTASDIYAFVCDDPDALFQIQADDSLDQNAVGTNAALVQTAGSTTTGDSKVALDASTIAGTATLPVRIVDFVRSELSKPGDDFTDVIVMFNTHFYRSTTGNDGS